MTTSMRRRARRQGGVTLVELMLAVTILAAGILTLVAVLSKSMNGGRSGLHLSAATQIAQSRLEQLQRDTWTNVAPTAGWTAPATVTNAVVQATGTATEQSYTLSYRITDVDPGRTRAVDVRVTWTEPNRPNRSVTLSSIRDNYEGV